MNTRDLDRSIGLIKQDLAQGAIDAACARARDAVIRRRPARRIAY